jgi:hypothetical protein
MSVHCAFGWCRRIASLDALCCDSHLSLPMHPQNKGSTIASWIGSHCRTSMASSGSRRGQRKAGGSISISAQPTVAGGRSAFSRGSAHHPSSSSANFPSFNGSVGDGGFTTFSSATGGGGGGWAPGLAFDGRVPGSDAVGIMEHDGGYGQMIAYLQIMTPAGPEPICCIYISSIHMSLHQLRQEIMEQLPAAHLPASWNFAKLSVSDGAMFVPLHQEQSMSMSLYVSPSGSSFFIVSATPHPIHFLNFCRCVRSHRRVAPFTRGFSRDCSSASITSSQFARY